MPSQAAKMRREMKATKRGVFGWMPLLCFVCAVLLLTVGGAETASSPPSSPPKRPPPSTRKLPPVVKLSPPPTPPLRSPPPRPTPPRPRPSPKSPPSPPKPPPPSPPPSPIPPSPPPFVPPFSPGDPDSCSFCAKVTIVEPTDLNMIPAICTDMATQVMYDIKELYSPSNVRNTGSGRISCAPDSRQVTICTSVQATALRTVAQAALDERVWGWTQVARFYIDDCKPFILISSEITSPDGCLTSDQSDAYACDIF
ncbi:hypothetical protein Vafri_10540 [Volvox africanus]|uniref:Pherophorin domain-containing protein n=1 Tax=Volvox africanus TaxID=51714 RepID=A0A8J4BAG9_9CHLO|nr:hypothetical protein Vafri_10540 [Volvox africanus]